jgi:hypothetical protein
MNWFGSNNGSNYGCSNLTYNRPPWQEQPYNNFLINGFNPGYQQNQLVNTRYKRQVAEATIDNIGKVGFWGPGSSYLGSLYGNSSGWGNSSISNSNESGNADWGGSNLTYNRPPWQQQPYDNFLINGYNPGYEQNQLVATRWNRRFGEAAIDSIGQQGFWGNFAYPRSLYGLS